MSRDENKKTNLPYDHNAVMRLRNAVLEMSGNEHDSVYLICAYLQQAVDPAMYKTITTICEMSDEETIEFLGMNKQPTEETK